MTYGVRPLARGRHALRPRLRRAAGRATGSSVALIDGGGENVGVISPGANADLLPGDVLPLLDAARPALILDALREIGTLRPFSFYVFTNPNWTLYNPVSILPAVMTGAVDFRWRLPSGTPSGVLRHKRLTLSMRHSFNALLLALEIFVQQPRRDDLPR